MNAPGPDGGSGSGSDSDSRSQQLPSPPAADVSSEPTMTPATTTPTKKKPTTRRPSALDRPRHMASRTLHIPRSGGGGGSGGLRPLHLTIRFVSLPDIELDLAEPHRMTVAALKPLIRAQLMHLEQAAAAEMRAELDPERRPTPPSVLRDAHRRRLRLIHSGKILADDAIVGNVLRPLPSPPSTSRTGGRSSSRSPSGDGSAARTPRIYVNCSIGDVQPESELMNEVIAATEELALLRGDGDDEEEEDDSDGDSDGDDKRRKKARLLDDSSLAATHDDEMETVNLRGGRDGGGDASTPAVPRRLAWPLPRQGRGSALGAVSGDGSRPLSGRNRNAPSPTTTNAPAPSTTPAPRGFDRLAAAGFSTAEVNQLRLQFRSIQATRFTPDAMPSPDTLRAMEDRWLDDSGSAGGLGALGGGGGGGTGTATGTNGADGWDDGALPPEDESGMPGLLDVMVRGMIVGFVYPLGAAAWLGREQGLWTRKWQVFVSFGLILSVMIGTIKTLAGEW